LESDYSLRAGLGTAHGVGGEKFFVSRVSRRLADHHHDDYFEHDHHGRRVGSRTAGERDLYQ